MGNKKEDGYLPGYASHLSRYCTTCREEIRFQVITKAKSCSKGHAVDLRSNTEFDFGRCAYCDNLIRASYVYCGTCGNENQSRDPQKKIRLMRNKEMACMWRMARELEPQARTFGLEVKVSPRAGLVLQMPRQTVNGMLALPSSDEASLLSSSSSNERSSQCSIPSTSSSGSGRSGRYNLRSSTFIPSSTNQEVELTVPAVVASSPEGTSTLLTINSQSPVEATSVLIQEIKEDVEDADFLAIDSEADPCSSIEFLEEVKPVVRAEEDQELNNVGDAHGSEGVSISSTPTTWKSVENKQTRNKRVASQKRTRETSGVMEEKQQSDDGTKIVTREQCVNALKNMRNENFKGSQ